MTEPKPSEAELREIAERARRHHAPGRWSRGPGAYIWAPSLKGGDNHVADVRGWGYLTGRGHGALGLSSEEAMKTQDAWGEHIATFCPEVVLALLDELEAVRANLAALLPAAETVLAGLCERIDAAPLNAAPVFAGIAELHNAIGRARGYSDTARTTGQGVGT